MGVAPGRVERLGGVRRLLAVGDVQSNHAPLVDLLAAAGFAVERDGVPIWMAEDATLLFLGDLLDGGHQPAEVLWLVMRLHEQAQAKGGRVVLIQGNHELMLFDWAAARADEMPAALRKWFANGGMETLLRMGASVGIPIPERLVAQMYIATLADEETDADVLAVAMAVQSELAPEIAFLKAQVRAAVVVNEAVLAVHAAPNFEANGLDSFVRDERDEITLAWSRSWLDDWKPGLATGPFVDRIGELKRRLDVPPNGFELRHLIFAHTALDAFAVPGFRAAQYRIGRLLGPEVRAGLPTLYDVLTAPRAVARGGTLGGLLIDSDGVSAVYGNEIRTPEGVWPAREWLGPPDPSFQRP
jgi:hypothetical protein